MSFHGKPHTTPDTLSEAVTKTIACVASLNMVDLLRFSSHSHRRLVKLQAFILVQKERAIFFVTLLSYHRTEVLISATAAHWSVLFYQNQLFLL